MAQEERRGCGFRKVGGLYLFGEYISVPCDRLPYPLTTCPTCGAGIKFSRGFTKINPLGLFGPHNNCRDKVRPCFVCDPTEEPAFIMGVGSRYYETPGDFAKEAQRMGVSKRIPWIPKELKLGETVVYLAHSKAYVSNVKEAEILQLAMAVVSKEEKNHQPRLVGAKEFKYSLGIFSAFIPQRVEKLIWEHDATPEELEKLKKRGITPVTIKDGDLDHI